MKGTHSFPEQEVLIGQYVLGVLAPHDHQRVQMLLSKDPDAGRSVLQWESTFLGLVDTLPPSTPPETILNDVLTALDLPLPASEPDPVDFLPPAAPPKASTPGTRTSGNAGQQATAPRASASSSASATLKSESPTTPASAMPQRPQRLQPEETPRARPDRMTANRPSPRPDKRPKRFWIGVTAAMLMLGTGLVLSLLPRTPPEPPVVIVEVAPSKGAILQAPGQSSTPGWIVTIDPAHNVTLTPRVVTDTPADTSVQLWTYDDTLRQPRSLGLIDPNQPVAVPADVMGEVSDGQFFEMTLEPAGGAPSGEPTGPILFIGRVVTFSQ